MRVVLAVLAAFLVCALPAHAGPPQEGTARHGDVSLHYVARGEANAPRVILLHGFPDYSATWDSLAETLSAQHYRTLALDLHGYNLSGAPEGVANYAIPVLLGDIDAVLGADGAEGPVTVIGHDWGAAIAWQYAMARPERVKNLVILSVPHPAGFIREMAANADQQRNSSYARDFQQPGAEAALTPEGLAQWVREPAKRARYVEAFRRSNFAGMLNYYRANYPTPTSAAQAAQAPTLPQIQAPTLVIHGMDDQALNAAGHSGTWNWVAKDTTLLMIPGAGHFVQHDAEALVNATIADWLALRR
jgi:pimeloyl-ACP methyl ester carboxylesterase